MTYLNQSDLGIFQRIRERADAEFADWSENYAYLKCGAYRMPDHTMLYVDPVTQASYVGFLHGVAWAIAHSEMLKTIEAE